MPSFPDNETGLRGRRSLGDDEGGAVLLMCLAALLILLLISWALIDGIFVVRDKSEVQASADVAAYSQASVKARSMNKLAFTNVAKRSLVGVYAVYEGMFEAYQEWLVLEFWWEVQDRGGCDPDHDFETCPDLEWRQNWDLFTDEEEGDYATSRDNLDYYVADLRALHNYQKYLVEMTPWWGWSEAVIRAQRNGATLAASFPPPRRASEFPFDRVVDDVAAQAGGGVGFTHFSSKVEGLPVETESSRDFWEGMVRDGMERDVWLWERQINAELHEERSQFGATENVVLERGERDWAQRVLREIGDAEEGSVYEELAQYGAPWRLRRQVSSNQAQWLFDTSNLVMTYRHQPEYFDRMAEKYEPIGGTHQVDPGRVTQQTYRPTGYWGMARSEISYQAEGPPDLWRSAWTARMRPVALPDEFRMAGEDFPMLYRSTVDYLMLSAHMHDDLRDRRADFFDDLVYFERASRAMGQSTTQGISR